MIEDEKDENVMFPEVGDTWRDLDPRSKGRLVKVVEVSDVAIVQTVGVSRRSRVRLDRFKPSHSRDGSLGKKGYVFVERPASAVLIAPVVPAVDLSAAHDEA